MTPGWIRAKERGTILGMRIVLAALSVLGYRAATWLLFPVVWYFYLTGKTARRASLDYLRTLHHFAPTAHRAPRFVDGWRHVWTFAQTVLERFWFWMDRSDRFAFETEGHEEIMRCYEAGTGCVFVGAHVGSFDALRVLSRGRDVVVNAVMDTRNARKVHALLSATNPAFALHIIDLSQGPVAAVTQMQACLARGEVVALLADRFPAQGRPRPVVHPFLGKPAPFPANPWEAVRLLRAPVFLVAGLRRGVGDYRCIARRVADPGDWEGTSAREMIEKMVARYANFLESLCVAHPYQWFNFFDFWSRS